MKINLHSNEWHNNTNYQKYLKQKQKITDSYPKKLLTEWSIKGNQDEYKMYKRYLKRITNLLFEPKGYYQKFLWDMEQYEMEREEARRVVAVDKSRKCNQRRKLREANV